MVQRFRALFVETAYGRMRRIDRAIAGPWADAAREIEEELHALAGEAAVVGFVDVGAAAREALVAARRGSRGELEASLAALAAGLPSPEPTVTPSPEPPRRAEAGAVRILLADDSEANRLTLGAFLEDAGFVVDEAPGAADCRRLLSAHRYDAAILDVHLGEDDGAALIPEVRAASPGAVAFLWTGSGATPPHQADGVFEKGIHPDALIAALRELLPVRT